MLLLVLGQQQLQLQLRRVMTGAGDRLRIPPGFTIVPCPDGTTRLHSLTFSLVLRDDATRTLARLLPMLEAGRTVAELTAGLPDAEQLRVIAALDYLRARGAVEPVDDATCGLTGAEMRRHRAQIAFFSHFLPPDDAPVDAGAARSGADFQARLKASRVTVLGLGRLGSVLVRDLALAGVGQITVIDDENVGIEDEHGDGWLHGAEKGAVRSEAVRRLAAGLAAPVDVVPTAEPDPTELRDHVAATDLVVLCRDYVDPGEYERLNEAAIATGTPWTSARIAGFELHVGPTVVPGETPCWTCFDLRRRSNVPDPEEHQILDAYLRSGRLRPERLAFTPGSSLLTLEVVKALTWFTAPATCGHLYTLDVVTMKSQLHPILKVPRCPSCGRTVERPTIHVWQQQVTG